jgi:hypothetical protein
MLNASTFVLMRMLESRYEVSCFSLRNLELSLGRVLKDWLLKYALYFEVDVLHLIKGIALGNLK